MKSNYKKLLKGKTILITGGTGSFGSNFSKHVLDNYDIKKLIIFSRDEAKQFELQSKIRDRRVRFFIGDVRDQKRLQRAFGGVDIVVHAAALKHVPAMEYNPHEAVKTNIEGSQNVIEAAIDQGVEKVLLISTDKAAHPANLYGASKLCAEKLFISGNSYANGTALSVVRYGNVIGSRGSLIENLLKNPNTREVYVTDLEMTRFWITLTETFELVLYALSNMIGGEIFVPKVPSMKIVDVFDALVPGARRKVTGIRPGEKIHEVLLTVQEARKSVDVGNYFVVLPDFNFFGKRYDKYNKIGKTLVKNFEYTSDKNLKWLSTKDITKIVNEFKYL